VKTLAWAVGLMLTLGAGDQALMAAAVAHIAIEPESFDFGRVRRNSELHKEFQVRNLGGAELEILEISTDCGCAAALLGEGDRKIPAGGRVTLQVRLETGEQSGRLDKRVFIRSNDPERPRLVLELTATVR